MTIERDPGDPGPEPPPSERDGDDRPPFESDPEAQHAPGANEQDPDSKESPPPMQAARD